MKSRAVRRRIDFYVTAFFVVSNLTVSRDIHVISCRLLEQTVLHLEVGYASSVYCAVAMELSPVTAVMILLGAFV